MTGIQLLRQTSLHKNLCIYQLLLEMISMLKKMPIKLAFHLTSARVSKKIPLKQAEDQGSRVHVQQSNRN
jgi:hypothetical protein